MPMSTRYAMDRDTSAGEAKCGLLAGMIMTVVKAGSSSSSVRRPYAPGSVTWENLRELAPSAEERDAFSRSMKYTGQATTSPSPGSPSQCAQLPIQVTDKSETEESGHDKTSSTSSSSSSSSAAVMSSAEDSDLNETIPPRPEELSDALSWFCQPGHRRGERVHFMHSYDGEGCLIPWCRDEPFSKMLSQEGTHVRQAILLASDPCMTCYRKMPTAVRAVLDHFWPDIVFEK